MEERKRFPKRLAVGAVFVLVLAVPVLAAAALVKYLFFDGGRGKGDD